MAAHHWLDPYCEMVLLHDFKSRKGGLEQLDVVMVLGIRVCQRDRSEMMAREAA